MEEKNRIAPDHDEQHLQDKNSSNLEEVDFLSIFKKKGIDYDNDQQEVVVHGSDSSGRLHPRKPLQEIEFEPLCLAKRRKCIMYEREQMLMFNNLVTVPKPNTGKSSIKASSCREAESLERDDRASACGGQGCVRLFGKCIFPHGHNDKGNNYIQNGLLVDGQEKSMEAEAPERDGMVSACGGQGCLRLFGKCIFPHGSNDKGDYRNGLFDVGQEKNISYNAQQRFPESMSVASKTPCGKDKNGTVVVDKQEKSIFDDQQRFPDQSSSLAAKRTSNGALTSSRSSGSNK